MTDCLPADVRVRPLMDGHVALRGRLPLLWTNCADALGARAVFEEAWSHAAFSYRPPPRGRAVFRYGLSQVVRDRRARTLWMMRPALVTTVRTGTGEEHHVWLVNAFRTAKPLAADMDHLEGEDFLDRLAERFPDLLRGPSDPRIHGRTRPPAFFDAAARRLAAVAAALGAPEGTVFAVDCRLGEAVRITSVRIVAHDGDLVDLCDRLAEHAVQVLGMHGLIEDGVLGPPDWFLSKPWATWRHATVPAMSVQEIARERRALR